MSAPAPEHHEPEPCAEAERYEAARAAGLRRPIPRCAVRGPVDPQCPRCGSYAPPVRLFDRDFDDTPIKLDSWGRELGDGCMRCIVQLVEEAA